MKSDGASFRQKSQTINRIQIHSLIVLKIPLHSTSFQFALRIYVFRHTKRSGRETSGRPYCMRVCHTFSVAHYH